ncbi:hypothetical protein PMX26_08660 [Collinsella aerofaciens]|uniref:hypothetical protein n=1 Tax=Collinsella aerofaciens TaxID=74426 RepID=UPI001896B081|nr:hypothetical protein [Collinsella aerofaciens]MDB1866491.1 hypothetical protein [Collinsella aerofaciens]MDB1870343.1 hypothetical protein [Collinsella aerofaciens]MDB1874304.1 hypothetical protein [Collinsella aerofaciens]
MTTTAAQINVRLDADLKRSGDAALSSAGITPSQAVRALWQLAASLADRPGALQDILSPGRARAKQREREKAAKHKLELIDQGSQLFAAVCRESGIDLARVQPSGNEELKRNAYADRYGEEMSWLYE